MEKNKQKWFVYPKNAFTNESICTQFGVDVEKWPREEDGKEIEVLRLKWKNIAMLKKSRERDRRIDFEVYERWGDSGPIKKHTFFLNKKNKGVQAAREAAEKIKKSKQ